MALYKDDNTETLDIPDFLEDKDSTDSTSVDMSIFKMSDEELYDDAPKKEEEKMPKNSNRKKSNSTIILCLVLVGILLLTSVVAVIFALKQRSTVKDLNEQVTLLTSQKNDLQNQVSTLHSKVDELSAQIEEAKNSGGGKADPNNKYPSGTVLYITEEGQGMGVKKEASVDSDFVDSDILDWGDKVTLVADAVVDDHGNYWGKIDKGFIRIEYNGENWASTDPQ